MKASQLVISVSDASHVGEVRRRARELAGEAGLNDSNREQAAIVATELATNLIRHATTGEVVVGAVGENSHGWVELCSIDRGPGIADIGRCLEDGYSTAGGPGNGLGAVRRLSTEWDMFSQRSSDSAASGTIVFSRIAEQPRGRPARPFCWAAISRPAPHEVFCGDKWRIAERDDELAVMIADGLGHGPEAAKAADEAGDVFDVDPFAPLTQFFQNSAVRMQGTRGGAVAAARIDARSRRLTYLGVGNIAGHLRDCREESGRGLVSHNGVVGGPLRTLQEFEYACPDEGLLVMHSDGLQSRWNLQAYPGLLARHPAVIAAVMYRDFTRGRDDVTVAVVRTSLGRSNASRSNPGRLDP
jgi:anti-sigma regulatory factor (Ser/Thr protein kinase)